MAPLRMFDPVACRVGSGMARAISICIPCYRDLEGLRATISSVVAALAETPSIQCQFAIGLNHCDFAEDDVLASFRDAGSHTFSIGKSGGYLEYDDSLRFTISHASQDVCLLMGCGDIAKPGLGLAIEKFFDDELKMGVLRVEHGAVCSPSQTRIGNWQLTDSGFFNKVISGHLFDGKVLREAVKDPLIGFEWGHVELAIRGAALAGGKHRSCRSRSFGVARKAPDGGCGRISSSSMLNIAFWLKAITRDIRNLPLLPPRRGNPEAHACC